ncbi:hypothetical protein DdX_16768 [Ditylenchus destructor]|uniref:Uncharacterized protein n=1 Tax=Ditylenchus destructor TaxID=166010 RepID=A0AAD4MQ91_9BILA|nr:hypothetical protein DdX_16768 [Ditylenchus destructor]
MKFLAITFVLCIILGLAFGEISGLRTKRQFGRGFGPGFGRPGFGPGFGRPGFGGGPGRGFGPGFNRGPTVVTKTVTKTVVRG